ncbi:hypothetical protein EST38_g9005 [Candolleomyces aberdarensis]|uniref:Uncharacterized protein n=1 Tax=Candolleomyces aberdarensis TaxID=2316362 RepID=A0A4Q2DEB3_9AGAR|nr:hypothetical protein EST38_g9005 [Candolleomyces aberdarensis]
MFPDLKSAVKLLQAFAEVEPPPCVEPSADVVALYERICDADPNSDSFLEEDTNEGWGHWQYTAGGLNVKRAVSSWNAVGSIDVACQLIAVGLKTCKVARHICFHRLGTMDGPGLMSDVFFEILVSQLWEMWKEVVPEKKSGENGSTDPQTGASNAGATDSDGSSLRKRLQSLLKDEVKQWTSEHNIIVASTNKQRSKDDYISAILRDNNPRPTAEDINAIQLKVHFRLKLKNCLFLLISFALEKRKEVSQKEVIEGHEDKLAEL